MTSIQKRRPRSKAEFVRLLWSAPHADFVNEIPEAPSFIVIERTQDNLLIVPWIQEIDEAKVPNWIWWPCYLASRDEVLEKFRDEDPEADPTYVQLMSLDDLKGIRDRYLQDL